MKLNIKKIVNRERNVFIGFFFVTLAISLLVNKGFWLIGLLLYAGHLVFILTFYRCKRITQDNAGSSLK